jgi:hypothetical protein
MAQRSRLGRAGDPRVLGAVAAALLLAALVVTGRVLSADRPSPAAPPPASSGPGTRPPLRLGGTVECPPGWPVLAAADHVSYPPGHPGQPPRVAAVACYRTAAQAADAGYAPAPLPPGAVEVGGVYLAPAGTAFRAGCRRAADRLGFAVPCPGLLPSLPPGAPPPRLCGEPGTCRRGQLLQFGLVGFEVAVDYVGQPGAQEPSGALLIVASPARAAAGGFTAPCPDERRIAAPTVHGARALLAACPEPGQASSYGGTVVLRWAQRGTVAAVSLIGWSEVNQRLRSRWPGTCGWLLLGADPASAGRAPAAPPRVVAPLELLADLGDQVGVEDPDLGGVDLRLLAAVGGGLRAPGPGHRVEGGAVPLPGGQERVRQGEHLLTKAASRPRTARASM